MFAEVYDFCRSLGVEPIIQGNKVNFTADDIIEGEASGNKVSVQITVKRVDKDDDYKHFVQVDKTAGTSGAFLKLYCALRKSYVNDYNDATDEWLS